MQIKRIIGNTLAVWGLLFCATAGVLAQEARKAVPLHIQTSARPERTAVYKAQVRSNEPAGAKASAADRQETAGKPESGPATPRPAKTGLAETGRYRALKTNVAYDACALLNLGFEMQVHPHITVELPLTWSFWDYRQEHGIRTVALQPEARWWTGKETGSGHFVGVHAHVAWFNVKWDENRYQDCGRPLLGAGLSYGYRLPLSEQWGAEFSLGLGYANMKYDTYYNIDNGARIDTRIRHYWGVTRIAASLTYRF